MIGSLGAATISFLFPILSRFRERHPMVEITLLHMHGRTQIDAVLSGSIILGIGFYSYVLEEDGQEQVSIRLIMRSPAGIMCPKNRRILNGTVPTLKDFRHDKFLSINPDCSLGYEQWLRGLCKRLGGFEPEITAVADSDDSLIGMVAAGRGVFVGPEVAIRGRLETWRSAGDFHLLTEPESHFELFAIWKRHSQVEPIISKFIDVLVAGVDLPIANSLP